MHPYEQLFSEGFQHQIRLLKNRAQLQRKMVGVVQQIERKWADRLITAASVLSQADINRVRRGVFTGSERLKEFARRLSAFTKALSEGLRLALVPELQELALYEARFWADRFAGLLSASPDIQIKTRPADERSAAAGVLGGAIVSAGILTQLRLYRNRRLATLRQKATAGAQSGGIQGLTKLFKLTKVARDNGRIFGETIGSVKRWVADAHLHATSEGTKAFVEANDQLDMVWTAMIDATTPGIDGRTTPICISRNGKLVNRDLDGQIPPAHHGCRSDIFPTIDYKALSRKQKKALDPTTRKVLQQGLPDLETSTKAFGGLSEAQQKNLLGATRFELFKSGDLKFPRDFIDESDERFYTLTELARQEGVEIPEKALRQSRFAQELTR